MVCRWEERFHRDTFTQYPKYVVRISTRLRYQISSHSQGATPTPEVAYTRVATSLRSACTSPQDMSPLRLLLSPTQLRGFPRN